DDIGQQAAAPAADAVESQQAGARHMQPLCLAADAEPGFIHMFDRRQGGAGRGGGIGRRILARCQNLAIAAPPIALSTTTSQGGTFHMNSSSKPATTSAKSALLLMPDVHTGL